MKTFVHYPMKALVNCRDLGGMPTLDGGVTKFGVLIRSELPENLPKEDIAFLRELNVTTSVDLRNADELSGMPSDLAKVDFINYLHIPVMSSEAALGSEVKNAADKQPGKGGPPKLSFEEFLAMNWTPVYCRMADGCPNWIYRIFEAFISAPGAMHFNCATGKDRTGLTAALLLASVGCSDDDICANYSLSETYMRSVYKRMAEGLSDYTGNENDLSIGFFGTTQNTMRNVLAFIREKYGTMTDYLKGCGVTCEMLAKVREKLVEY